MSCNRGSVLWFFAGALTTSIFSQSVFFYQLGHPPLPPPPAACPACPAAAAAAAAAEWPATGGRPPAAAPPAAAVAVPCADLDPSCTAWGAAGECGKNLAFMQVLPRCRCRCGHRAQLLTRENGQRLAG